MGAELWTKVVGTLLLPPGLLLIVAALGFLLQLKWRWFGNFVVAVSFATLLALSTTLTGKQMLDALEVFPPLTTLPTPEEAKQRAGAIVVLAGGRYAEAPEYGADTVNSLGLTRVRYGAWLQRRLKLPLLVSGGSVAGEALAEAELMRRVLEEEYGIKPQWVETASATTYENALHSSRILREAGVGAVYLVTHAWHMPRAVWAFERFGIKVYPAPTAFTTLNALDRGIVGYLPSSGGLRLSSLALHERLGLYWYRARYGSSSP